MTTEELLKKIKRVKIVAKEGILRATHVYTDEGQEIGCISNLNIRVDDGIFVVDLSMWRAELDLEDVKVGKKLLRCGHCKAVEELTDSKI